MSKHRYLGLLVCHLDGSCVIFYSRYNICGYLLQHTLACHLKHWWVIFQLVVLPRAQRIGRTPLNQMHIEFGRCFLLFLCLIYTKIQNLTNDAFLQTLQACFQLMTKIPLLSKLFHIQKTKNHGLAGQQALAFIWWHHIWQLFLTNGTRTTPSEPYVVYFIDFSAKAWPQMMCYSLIGSTRVTSFEQKNIISQIL